MTRTILLGCLLVVSTHSVLLAQSSIQRVLTGNWDGKNDPTGMGDNPIFGTVNPSRRETFFSPVGILPIAGAAGGVSSGAGGAERVYLSSPTGGTSGVADQLYLFDPIKSSITLLGEVVGPNGALRMDGLAFATKSQQLLAWSNDPDQGTGELYSLDPLALTAAPLFDAPVISNVEGIDADAETGIIYALDDLTRSISIVDPAGGLSFFAAYPAGANDLDGLAAGGGFLYLFGSRPGDSFYIYDFAKDAYISDQQGQVVAFPVPFTEPGTTSGAAYFVVPEPAAFWLPLVAFAAVPFRAVRTARRRGVRSSQQHG